MTTAQDSGIVEMNWDPITRIVGSLGIYTKIDFKQKKVVECYSTSSIFRGYSIFMKGKDPRDAHFITSRICTFFWHLLWFWFLRQSLTLSSRLECSGAFTAH